MERDLQGRMLLHQDGVWAADELAGLTAELQRRFPDRVIESADERWLGQLIAGSAAEGAWRSYHRDPTVPDFRSPGPEHVDYLYLVLGWLGGTVSKQVVEQVVKAATAAVIKAMQSRSRKAKVILFGPDGEKLGEVEVDPSRTSGRGRGSIWRKLGSWRHRGKRPAGSRGT
jgi:hypothetical protein